MKFSDIKLRKILDKTDNHCYYCEVRLHPGRRSGPWDDRPGAWNVDHLYTVDGGNYLDNLVPSCVKCNFCKGSMQPEDFFLSIGRPVPAELMANHPAKMRAIGPGTLSRSRLWTIARTPESTPKIEGRAGGKEKFRVLSGAGARRLVKGTLPPQQGVPSPMEVRRLRERPWAELSVYTGCGGLRYGACGGKTPKSPVSEDLPLASDASRQEDDTWCSLAVKLGTIAVVSLASYKLYSMVSDMIKSGQSPSLWNALEEASGSMSPKTRGSQHTFSSFCAFTGLSIEYILDQAS